MFTGIIEHLGKITKRVSIESGLRLFIDVNELAFIQGESVAVDGICLTAIESGQTLIVDISPETIAKTTINNYQVGQIVNLEKALLVGKSLSGHFVTGHVDGHASIKEIKTVGEFKCLVIDGFPDDAYPYLIKKGSISIDGISLTINEVLGDAIECMIIPHTFNHTNLKQRNGGDRVNIEYDYIARCIERQLSLQKARS